MVITIVGSDTFLVNEMIEDEVNTIKTEDTDIINYDQSEGSLAILLEEMNTIPFLSLNKIIILKSPIFLETPSKYDPKLIEAFVSFLKKPVETTSLIIVIDDFKNIDNDLRNTLYSETIVKEVKKFDKDKIDSFITEYLAKNDYTISSDALIEFIKRTGDNLTLIKTELAKLMAYKGESKNIYIEDIYLLINQTLDDTIYDLSNAILEHRKKDAIDIYYSLKEGNVDEALMISFLIRNFNEIYQVKALVEKGYTKDSIAEVMKVKPGRAYYMIKNASRLNLNTIKNSIKYLTDLEFNYKIGKNSKERGLELFILK